MTNQFTQTYVSHLHILIGLSTCFVVNELTHAGQPALLYLDPACIGSALAVGAANGQLSELWNFEEEEQEGETE